MRGAAWLLPLPSKYDPQPCPRCLAAVVLGLTACAPAVEVNDAVLTEQAEDYVSRIVNTDDYAGSGTIPLRPEDATGGEVTLAEMTTRVGLVRATCFGEGAARVDYEVLATNVTAASGSLDVPCDGTEHDAVVQGSVGDTDTARLHASWVSGSDVVVVVSVFGSAAG